jgi:predicted secreted protein/Tol biopolymer transport system component
MKWSNDYRMRLMLIGFVAAIVLIGGHAKADFTFGEPTNLGATINSSAGDAGPCISADGLALYFSSTRPGGYGDKDLWVTTRPTTNDEWTEPVNLGPTINSSAHDAGPCISADGLALYFSSERPGGYGGGRDLWVTTRPTTEDPWTEPVNLGPTVNSSDREGRPCISSDGLSLYFNSPRPGGFGYDDLYVTTRVTVEDDWGQPANLGPTVNASYNDFNASISADGRLLFFASSNRPGFGLSDLWVTRREAKNDDWGTTMNVGPPINSSAKESGLGISTDGRTIYFNSDRPGGQGSMDLWQVPIIPIVDLNGDGIVDAADMCIIVDQWGTDDPLCDIGPMPWGDGIVDVQDLIVLAEHLFEVYPSAETVEVNKDNDGGQVELELGKLLVVTLVSNPSTGYRWELIENNESILKQFGQAEFKSSETGEPPIVGAGGWEIFRFKAVSAGQMTLELVYHRSWEDAEPLKTFSIQVTVN